jgi:hypothetical protein
MKKLKQILFDIYCIWDNPLTQMIIVIALVVIVILLINGKL